MGTVWLALLECKRHGFKAISIEDKDGHGYRITPGKCCGSWQTMKRWKVTAEDMREAAGYLGR